MSFLATEAALVARLTERLPATVRVLTAADLASVAEGSQPTPAVHVVYQGHRVAERRADGRALRLTQTWLTVVAVRNVRDARSGAAAREDASALVDAVFAALMGWQPDGLARPLAAADAAQAAYVAGFMYLPIGWQAERVLTQSD